MSSDKLTRIAIVNPDKCQPRKCAHECRKSCPVNRMGKVRRAVEEGR
jgi:ATP-binding cassette subfamily E protein 1